MEQQGRSVISGVPARPAGAITFSLAALHALVIGVAHNHPGVAALASIQGHSGASPELPWNRAASGIMVYAASTPLVIDIGIILAPGTPIAPTASALATAIEQEVQHGLALATHVNIRLQGVR